MAETLSRDPYKDFLFKVYFDSPKNDNKVAGVNSVSGLSWSVEVINISEGGGYHGSRKLPGGISYGTVTLSKGIVSTEEKFKEWAEAVWNYSDTNPLENLRKTVIIDLCDENGFPSIRYTLNNCWVSEYNALPELSSDGSAIAIESINVEHEGWTQEIKPAGSNARKAGE